MYYLLLCAGIHQRSVGEPCKIGPLSPREIVDERSSSPCEIHLERCPSSGGDPGSHSPLWARGARRLSPLDRDV